MQPTLFTATYSSCRAAEASRSAAATQLAIPRKKHAALVAITAATAEWFRSMRSMTTARSR